MSGHLGELLLQKGILERGQLEQAVSMAQQNGGLLNAAVVNLGFIEEDALTNLISRQYGLPVVQLEEYQIEARVRLE